MTSIALLKLATDGLLFASLVFLSFKVLSRQSPVGPNLQKLKELETSLKEVVKDADDASRNFSDELLSRKRDLEKLLAEIQASEAKLSKSERSLALSIEEASLAERNLTLALQKSGSAASPAKPVIEKIESSPLLEQTFIEPSFNAQRYSKIPEPPSFSQLAAAAESKKQKTPSKSSHLSNLIERTIEKNKLDLGGKRDVNNIEQTLRSIAKAAEKSVQASKLPDHLETALHDVEENQASLFREDPRLGVLGKRSSQVV